MNERIRELVKQAGFHPDSNWDHTDWHAAGHSDLFEKFAELIVRECADLMNSDKDSDRHVMWNRALYETRGKILRHFGVGE